jgi:hypothetical protein
MKTPSLCNLCVLIMFVISGWMCIFVVGNNGISWMGWWWLYCVRLGWLGLLCLLGWLQWFACSWIYLKCK